jgi:hypothetical protein
VQNPQTKKNSSSTFQNRKRMNESTVRRPAWTSAQPANHLFCDDEWKTKKSKDIHHRRQEVANAKSIAHGHPSYVPIYPSTDTRARPHRNSWDPPCGPGHARREVYLSSCPHRKVRIYSALFSCPFSSRVIYIYNPAFLYITTLPPPRLRFPCSCSSRLLPSPQAPHLSHTPRSLARSRSRIAVSFSKPC